MQVLPIKTRIFAEGEPLKPFITEHIPVLADGSVLVITSKIVALSEGRTADLGEEGAIIQSESEWQKETTYGSLTYKDGLYMWNAGIDASNADGKLVLLPKDSFAAASAIRSQLTERYKISRLGILITDSRIMPLRAGVVGVALGYAGFKGLRDYRGHDDIFGRPLKYTQTDLADALASAAITVMGEGSEQQPLCTIEDAPVEFVDRVDSRELIIAPDDDMYGPLLRP